MLVKDGEATQKGWKSAQRVVWKELETTLPARLPKNTGKETQQPKTQVPDRETQCWFGEDSSWLGTAGRWMMVYNPTCECSILPLVMIPMHIFLDMVGSKTPTGIIFGDVVCSLDQKFVADIVSRCGR